MSQEIHCKACDGTFTHDHPWEPSLCALCGVSLSKRSQIPGISKRRTPGQSKPITVVPTWKLRADRNKNRGDNHDSSRQR